jgi:hypothetical protein
VTGEIAVCRRPGREDGLLSDVATAGTAYHGADPGLGLLAGPGIDPVYAEPSIKLAVYPWSGAICVEGTGEMPRWLLPTLSGLRELAALPAGWDSYGAPPIDAHCVAKAVQVLVEVMEPDTPAPSVVPTSRGGVQFEWHTGGVDFEIEVEPTNLVSAYYRAARGGLEKEIPPTTEILALKSMVAELRAT